MAPYQATAWINNTPPPLSAANLNKLTDELEAQAAAEAISHSLPTWADGVAPALTDPAPLNEMERVVDLVATARGITYIRTIWQAGWTPSRNAYWLNHLEQGAYANSVAVPATGTLLYSHTYTGAQATAPDYGWDWGFLKEGNSSAQIIPDGLALGVPSMRATLPASASSMHVEGVKKWLPWAVGERLFVGLQFKLPTNWTNPNSSGWGAAISQTYYQSCVNHTQGIFLHGDHARFVLLAGLQTISGSTVTRGYDNTDGAPQGPSPRAITVGRLTAGVVHTLIEELVPSYNPVGMIRIWHKIAGEANYTKTVDLQNVPTLQYGTCYSGSWPFGATVNVSHKLGFYAGASSQQRVFDSGNYQIGTTFEIVEAQMR